MHSIHFYVSKSYNFGATHALQDPSSCKTILEGHVWHYPSIIVVGGKQGPHAYNESYHISLGGQVTGEHESLTNYSPAGQIFLHLPSKNSVLGGQTSHRPVASLNIVSAGHSTHLPSSMIIFAGQ